MKKKIIKELTPEEYREIVNFPTHLIVLIRPDGTFYKVNEEANPVLGWEPEEAIGEPVSKFVHPDDLDETLGVIGGVFLGTRPLVSDFVNRCRRKDGTYRSISWTIKAKGGLLYGLGTDVTEKVEFEEALAIQSLILESISEGVIINDFSGKIVYSNSAAEKLFGYQTGELVGLRVQELSGLGEEENQGRVSVIVDELRKSKLYTGEFTNLRRDKKTITTSCRITPLSLKGQDYIVSVLRDITQSKELEKAAHGLHSRFKIFFEQSILPMLIYDLAGRPLAANRAWEKLFQSNFADIQDYNIFEDPQLRKNGTLEFLNRALMGESVEVPPVYYDPSHSGRKGPPSWIEAWFSPVKDAKGDVIELAVILKDVTESRKTQDELVKSNTERKVALEGFRRISDRLALAVKVGKIGIWDWVPGTEKVSWDETTEAIYGYEPGKFPGKASEYTERIHPDDRDRLWGTVARCLQDGKPYVLDHRVITKDGQLKWVESSGTAILGADGKATYMMGTVIDVTERKQAEEDQKFLASVSDLLSSSFEYRENLQKLAELVSTYFCDGCTVDQLEGSGHLERIALFHPNPISQDEMMRIHKAYPQRYESDHPLSIALISGKTHQSEVKDYRKQKNEKLTDYYEEIENLDICSVIVSRLKGRDSLLGTISFFTIVNSRHVFNRRHHWLAEEIAYRVAGALENSLLFQQSQEAVQARDEFLSIASHELKTPLTSLSLQNQMRRRQFEKEPSGKLDAAKVTRMLDSDYHQLSRINRLIEDMLDITRIRAHRLTIDKEDFEFTQFVSDVLERFKPQMEAVGCNLQFAPGEPLTVIADSYRIEQVLVNLLTNAMKYGAGKPIKVEIQVHPTKVNLLVHDRGPGVAEEDVERIFQRFERAISSSEVSGLGLGLYISRQIMEQHEGNLSVLSQIGYGSTFIMELPR